jgi:hypothetical protein
LKIFRYHLSILIFLLLLFAIPASGQNLKAPNTPKYDKKPYHFGFLLGINQMDFLLRTDNNYLKYDSLMVLQSVPQKGFDIGIVGNLRLAEHFDLRFIPALSFGDRMLEYTIRERDTSIVVYNKKIESTFIDLPLTLKYKSARITNFRVYAVGGLKYSYDLASQFKKKTDSDEYVVKLKKSDYHYLIGAGIDYYFPLFKFSIEYKIAFGIPDILKRENVIFTDPITRLNSKISLISITFE